MKTKAERIDGMQKEAAKARTWAKRTAWMVASWELEASLTPEERLATVIVGRGMIHQFASAGR